MNANRLDRIAELYAAALEEEPVTRQAFVLHVCHGDDLLRREVESLLAVHGDAQHFLSGSLDRLFVPEADGPNAVRSKMFAAVDFPRR